MITLYNYIDNNGTILWLILTWVNYFLNVFIDRNNEMILTKVYKAVGLIEDDESFDALPLMRMRKRRFSSEFFVDIIDEVKEKKELIHAIKKQDYLYSISYKNVRDGDIKVKNYKKFSRIVFLVMFCIREKTEEAKKVRDEKFISRAGPLENFRQKDVNALTDSDDNEDDEISLKNFRKKQKGGKISRRQGAINSQMSNVQKLIFFFSFRVE